MIDLDERFGFMRWRLLALAVNLLGNAIALYGAVRLFRDGTHASVLATGLLISLACLVLLSRPDLRSQAEDEPGGEGWDPDAL